MLPFSWFVVFRTLFCRVPHNSIYYTLSRPVCQHFFSSFLCFVSFYNARPIFLKTYVHMQHQNCTFCPETGFFHDALSQKIRRATRPTDKISQILFFIKLFFELLLLLLHKLHKILQRSRSRLCLLCRLCLRSCLWRRLLLRLRGYSTLS